MDFIAAHDFVFVVEQNESGQMRTLLINEGELDPKCLISVLHYDGTPITARFITKRIADILTQDKATPLRQQVAS
jgi:2-oxoglutarate ferredoxin oxidoreductase subunit alpha